MTLPSPDSMARLAAINPQYAAVALLLAYQEALRLLGETVVENERLTELASVNQGETDFDVKCLGTAREGISREAVSGAYKSHVEAWRLRAERMTPTEGRRPA